MVVHVVELLNTVLGEADDLDADLVTSILSNLVDVCLPTGFRNFRPLVKIFLGGW